MKKQNVGVRLDESTGITLVALVVTIIVLLILAGVSLNLVAGSNGILGRAQKAVDIMNMAKIKEEVELKIAELQMDYYTEKNDFANVNDYVKAKLREGVELSNGAEISCDENGALSYEGLEIGTFNPDGTVTIDGELSGNQIVTKYAVSYDANGGTGAPATKKYTAGENVVINFEIKPSRKGYNFLGWAKSSTAATPEYTTSGSFTMGTQSVTLYAVWESLATAKILPTNYGDNVSYSANGVSDWKVFLNDGDNVYIIASDYVPNTNLNKEDGITAIGTYSISGSSVEGLVNWLQTNSYWDIYTTGLSGATAKGGPNHKEFWASYNAKYGTDYGSLYHNIATQAGYNDLLYFPHKEKWNGVAAYWLSSAESTTAVQWVYSSGYVGGGPNQQDYTGVRPLVKLPASAKATWNGTAWDLAE